MARRCGAVLVFTATSRFIPATCVMAISSLDALAIHWPFDEIATPNAPLPSDMPGRGSHFSADTSQTRTSPLAAIATRRPELLLAIAAIYADISSVSGSALRHGARCMSKDGLPLKGPRHATTNPPA